MQEIFKYKKFSNTRNLQKKKFSNARNYLSFLHLAVIIADKNRSYRISLECFVKNVSKLYTFFSAFFLEYFLFVGYAIYVLHIVIATKSFF